MSVSNRMTVSGSALRYNRVLMYHPGLADALEDVTAAKAPTNGKILSENEDTGDNMTFSRANISALD